MPTPTENQPSNRPADTIVKTSEQRLDSVALISKTKIKSWKVLLACFFLVGFIGTIIYISEFRTDVGEQSKAQTPSIDFANLKAGYRNFVSPDGYTVLTRQTRIVINDAKPMASAEADDALS